MNIEDINFKAVIDNARIIGDNKKYFNLEGLFSHLSYGNNLEYTNYQINNFKKIISVMEKYKTCVI